MRHQVVGHRGDRAVEHLGQPVVRVQLLPQRRRRRSRGARGRGRAPAACRRTAPRCSSLALTPCELGVALEQRLQARRVLLPQRLPHRDRLRRRLRARARRRAAACRRSDARARCAGASTCSRSSSAIVARSRGAKSAALTALQLADELLVDLRDVAGRQRLRPAQRAVGIGERERTAASARRRARRKRLRCPCSSSR